MDGNHEELGEKARHRTGQTKDSTASPFSGSQSRSGSFQDPMGRQQEKEMFPDHGDYSITLTFDGQLCQHRVTADMAVLTLIRDAAQIYGLVALDVILVLFGMLPRSLVRGKLLADPPQVNPGATILVFNVPNSGFFPAGQPPETAGHMHLHPDIPLTTPKFLGNFKLPKFDGTARHWKAWDKTFVRFLSIHQLDHVIAESFLDMLPLTPQAFHANKMVYYILEDAIIPGSLAAKYLRLAAKWNGNEAYGKLYDGYVFSGPQTMAILLAELVNLRFVASESASGFCLRLRELFEDLEMVPGSSAIVMNDTQKIGYLLSGIRQEKPLQAVYVALQV
jgi:hypothetical protein